MKVKNFPERKRQRQISALKRLFNSVAHNPRKEDTWQFEHDKRVLESISPLSLRNICTKKRRGN